MKQNTIQNVRPLFGLLMTVGLLLLAVLTAAVMLTGCVKRELEMRPAAPEEGTVEVGVVWPEGADCNAARLLIYDEAGMLNCSEEFSAGENRFVCMLAAGNYRLILHNGDAQNVGYAATESHGTAEVYALNASGQKPSSQDDALAEPHKVYGIGRHDQGEHFTVTAGETLPLTVTPVRLTREVHFDFAVTGLDDVKSVVGTLSGVAPSVLLCTRECRQEAFGLPFEGVPHAPRHGSARVKAGAEPAYFRATLELFDLLTRKGSPAGTNGVEAVVTAGDGRSYPVQVDITEALQQLIDSGGDVFPVEIPLEIALEIDPVTAEVRVTVTPWDGGGTGGGDFE